MTMGYLHFLQVFKNWRTRRFWRGNWMKDHRDIFTLNWKTSLLMKINSHFWLKTALQRLQCIFIILWKYANKHRTGAAALIRGRRLLTFPVHVRRLIEGGAYSRTALIRVNASWNKRTCSNSGSGSGSGSDIGIRFLIFSLFRTYLPGGLWSTMTSELTR